MPHPIDLLYEAHFFGGERWRPSEPQNAPPKVKEICDRMLKGKPGKIQKALAHRPDLLASFLPFCASVGKSLDRRLYELIYPRVSILNGCNY
jgi:alkylhydroperoxidase family enzyme